MWICSAFGEFIGGLDTTETMKGSGVNCARTQGIFSRDANVSAAKNEGMLQ